ncbi:MULTISPECIES: TRAP transporter substrate-binding protein [Halomonadaceae]|uniref:TRAP transporter substrate-binding protein n=1 Tax=Halomonadaceae TaxID=28256 RepID=UPI001599AE99|nr:MULTISPECIES: TRAP transporter substrate-binding protein [Halomonas]QJQ96751.1 TRAP transporter substrate-binding protein DctP [Halomonas sp. PA5]
MTHHVARHALNVAIGGITLAGLALQAQAATEVSVGYAISSDSHYGEGSRAFKETLERLSDGEFTVTDHPSGSLGGERAMIEGLQIGTVDIVITSTGPLGNFVPETYVLDLPFLFDSYDQARCVLDGETGQELLDSMTEHDLVGLAWSENGFRHITNSRRAINSPEDVSGLKIRTMENRIHQQAFQQMGASPTPMAMPELFTALQQGTVDGQENPVTVIVAANLFEVQDQLSLTGHVYSPAIMLGSPVLLDSLSDEQREWFHEAARAAAEATRAEVSRLEEEGVELLRERGMTVNTEVDPEPFQQAVQSVHDSFVEQYGSEMLERIQASSC